MRAIWAACVVAGCVAVLAGTQAAEFPMVVVIMSVLTMVVSWL